MQTVCPAEVAARLQALIRRRYGQLSEKLVLGDVEMDPVAMTVTRNGVPVSLKGKELALLALFLRNPQKVLSRAMIEEKLYNWDEDVSSNAVEVHIHHLRRKLGRGFIKTIHGVGYVAGKMMKTYSLRLRLGGLLLLLTLLTWGVASMFAGCRPQNPSMNYSIHNKWPLPNVCQFCRPARVPAVCHTENQKCSPATGESRMTMHSLLLF